MVLLQIILIVLKVLGYISWPWYFVLAPFIITFLRGMMRGLHEGLEDLQKILDKYEINN
ncbi:hypothetical protein NH288_05460 [Anaerococcus sp. NML200537]|uniref:hypothetical protein n=1 Tax=Anaerococcus sp. NML200537 TaxID=2954485 RepID=UPI002239096B|nr:hypothetical protein [Anaerococcus sp. NML200537]MCW6701530.1 hypothetical protein [Anaerococcus sp. NML200537]